MLCMAFTALRLMAFSLGLRFLGIRVRLSLMSVILRRVRIRTFSYVEAINSDDFFSALLVYVFSTYLACTFLTGTIRPALQQ